MRTGPLFVAFASFLLSAPLVAQDHEILYEQSSPRLGSWLLPGDSNDTTRLADDFVVPAGAEWTLSRVSIRGTLNDSMRFSIAIHRDGGGKPGQRLTGTIARVESRCCDFPADLPAPLTLDNGTYWLVIGVWHPTYFNAALRQDAGGNAVATNSPVLRRFYYQEEWTEYPTSSDLFFTLYRSAGLRISEPLFR